MMMEKEREEKGKRGGYGLDNLSKIARQSEKRGINLREDLGTI